MPTLHDVTPAGWPPRFRVLQDGEDVYLRDWLVPPMRRMPRARFAYGDAAALARAYIREGLLPTATSAVAEAVRDRPHHPDDGLFWQFPCRTEAAAWELHAALDRSGMNAGILDLYLGLPWATWIDKNRKQAWGPLAKERLQQQLRFIRLRLRGWRELLDSQGLSLRLHTVCQHVAWHDMLPIWQSLGITDLWLSHCPKPERAAPSDMRLRPWRLFAVNVEDMSRREGLQIGRDPADRPLVASFVGAHAPGYLSDIRLRLAGLANQAGFVVRLTEEWHFERQVYREQVMGQPVRAAESADASVRDYNQLLTDARFALCPSGTGPNTLRLWEALAAGSVPVLLGVLPQLPAGGSLPPIDWDTIVLRVEDAELSSLPDRLRAMPISEVRRRAQAGMAAFELVRRQTCF